MKESLKTILSSGLYVPDATVWLNSDPVASKIGEHAQCLKCLSKECRKSVALGESRCSEGLSYYTYSIGDSIITLYGIFGAKANQSDKVLKKLSKGRGYPKNIADNWIDKLSQYIYALDSQIEKAKSEVLHYFHDSVKWATQINISAEKIIEKGKGHDFGEKLDGSTSEIKSLFQASNMLVDSFKLTSIYFNPESAKYGETQNCEIYKLFDKVQAIIFHSEGKKYNKRFKLKGESFRRVSVYESFPIIPLCLIQNAVKYSKTSEIEININDTQAGVEVSIVSEGPHLDSRELVNIFQKGFRGKHAKRLHHDGLGIGLYVAQHVAKAHNTEIFAYSTPQNYHHEGMPMALIEFKFLVHAHGVK
jgi:hypothetical protein